MAMMMRTMGIFLALGMINTGLYVLNWLLIPSSHYLARFRAGEQGRSVSATPAYFNDYVSSAIAVSILVLIGGGVALLG